MYCEQAEDHEPLEECDFCGLPADEYGNTEEDFLNCCFPNCGCDGSRLCQAPSGANADSLTCNVENMYEREDIEAVRAKRGLYLLVNPFPHGD